MALRGTIIDKGVCARGSSIVLAGSSIVLASSASPVLVPLLRSRAGGSFARRCLRERHKNAD